MDIFKAIGILMVGVCIGIDLLAIAEGIERGSVGPGWLIAELIIAFYLIITTVKA